MPNRVLKIGFLYNEYIQMYLSRLLDYVKSPVRPIFESIVLLRILL